MKKDFLKRLAFTLLACTFLFVGCADDETDETENENGGGGASAEESVVRETFDGGVHQYDYTETTHVMAENGSSGYKIVVEENAPKELVIASEELQMFFKEATGATLPIVTDASVGYSQTAELIVLGQNNVFQNAGLSTDGLNLGMNGYMIKTKGNSVFITGDDVYGTLFGVYGFLELEYNFDCFAVDCYTIDQKAKTTLKNFDVLDLPDIPLRSGGESMLQGKVAEKRMRFMPRDNKLFAGTIGVHSTFECFPKATYEATYPNFYNAEKNELCYTAHGNEQQLALMHEIALKYVQDNFIQNTEAHMITFSHQDTMSWCYCEACAAVKEKYGAFSATAIHFINDLADDVEAWMETPEGQPYARDFKITFLAYTTTEAAPVKYDEKTDTFTPVDDTVICGDHVQVMFAPINMDYQNSIYEEVNASYYKNFRAWRVLCDEFNIYSYHSNYIDFLSFFDTFEQLQEFYIFAANSNTQWLYDLGQGQNMGGATGWHMLKIYLNSKFGWNVNYNFNELVDKFFNAYYGPAANVMMQIFQEQRARYAYNLEYEGLTVTRSCYAVLTEDKYWPKNLLDRWVELYDEALAAIAPLQYTDFEKYELYSKNIRMERLSVYYSMVAIHENKYSAEYMWEVKNECKDIAALAGIIKLAEGDDNTLVNLWMEWGIL